LIPGYSHGEIESLKFPEGYHNDVDLDNAEIAIEKVLQGERGIVELSLVTKSGRLVPTEYSISAVPYENGGSRFLIAIGTLAGGLAHDFNNIIGAAKTNLELIAIHNSPTPDEVEHHVHEANAAITRAANLTRQLLNFSSRRQRNKEEFYIKPIVKEALKFLRSSLPSTIEMK
jgi:signal transduction histidine kinase